MLLPLIDSLLRTAKTRHRDISRIIVVRGPGPFTAVRTGLVVANTLGMILDVPVQGIISAQKLKIREVCHLVGQRITSKKPFVARPWYGREPNVTLSHKKAVR